MDVETRLPLLALAMIADGIIGDPRALWDRVPHPAVLLGRLVDWLDAALNRDGSPPGERYGAGLAAAAAILLAGLGAGGLTAWAIGLLPLGRVLEVAAVAVLLAGRSLYDHVKRVADGLAAGGLAGGRDAVALIVGRDPGALDEPGVSRAAIESLAENFSDGVVAPAFWYVLFGLPGLVAYKAVNTADSMIGHKTPRHLEFGAGTARLDDLLNWVPARLSGLMIVLGARASGHDAGGAFGAMRRDARHHRSPNAGWPEAAMAGALGVALAGPRTYHGAVVEDAVMNQSGRREARISDIAEALKVYTASNLMLMGVAVMAAVLLR